VIVPHHLNFRYICPAFGPFYLVAGLGFSGVIGAIMPHLSVVQRRGFAGYCVLVVLFCAVGDVLTFENHFVQTDMRDLSIRMVLNPDATDDS